MHHAYALNESEVKELVLVLFEPVEKRWCLKDAYIPGILSPSKWIAIGNMSIIFRPSSARGEWHVVQRTLHGSLCSLAYSLPGVSELATIGLYNEGLLRIVKGETRRAVREEYSVFLNNRSLMTQPSHK